LRVTNALACAQPPFCARGCPRLPTEAPLYKKASATTTSSGYRSSSYTVSCISLTRARAQRASLLLTRSPLTPQLVNLRKLETVSLKRYRRVFQLGGAEESPHKEALLPAVLNHFTSQVGLMGWVCARVNAQGQDLLPSCTRCRKLTACAGVRAPAPIAHRVQEVQESSVLSEFVGTLRRRYRRQQLILQQCGEQQDEGGSCHPYLFQQQPRVLLFK
jgi:hypothetical protein